MIYAGGKSKIGKEIANFIAKYELKENGTNSNPYFEPFCGMLGVGIHFAKKGRKVKANDVNKDLIALLKKIKKGWKPSNKHPSVETYAKFKESKRHSAERGFVGFSCAYSGIFFAGYRVKNESGRDYFDTFRKGLIELKEPLSRVSLTNKNYTSFNPRGMTIYCDPPYKNNTFKSKHFDDFDSELFWK